MFTGYSKHFGRKFAPWLTSQLHSTELILRKPFTRLEVSTIGLQLFSRPLRKQLARETEKMFVVSFESDKGDLRT